MEFPCSLRGDKLLVATAAPHTRSFNFLSILIYIRKLDETFYDVERVDCKSNVEKQGKI